MAYSLSRNQNSGSYRNIAAFAVLSADGSVRTFGNEKYAGRINYAPASPVIKIAEGPNSFAFISEDGSVAIFVGSNQPTYLYTPEDPSQGAKDVFSTEDAFVILKKDKSITSYGLDISGGQLDKSGELNWGVDMAKEIGRTVDQVYASSNAFVVRMDRIFQGLPTKNGGFKNGGSNLFGWPKDSYGGDASALKGKFQEVWANQYAFTAAKRSGRLFAWGHPSFGGEVPAELSARPSAPIETVAATNTAFAALNDAGEVQAWGDQGNGGRIPARLRDDLSQVDAITGNNGAFLALNQDGSVVAWGNPSFGGRLPRDLRDRITGAESIHASDTSFAVVAGSRIYSWGSAYIDRNVIDLPQGTSVEKVVATSEAFGVLTSAGQVLTWGKGDFGGRPPKPIAPFLTSGIVDITANYAVISVLTEDGKMLSWGDSDFGGRTMNGPVAFPSPATTLA